MSYFEYVIPPEIQSVLEEEGDTHDFESNGVRCLMYRNQEAKNWCGYVILPDGHPLTGKDLSDVHLEVHGGITFSGRLKEHPDKWAVGFDCHHAWDLAGYVRGFGRPYDSVYRNKAYVEAECVSLARQVVEYKEPEADTKAAKLSALVEAVRRSCEVPSEDLTRAEMFEFNLSRYHGLRDALAAFEGRE